ncbi:MAG: acyl-CoA dehydrogenase family protein [Alphaproteobacteria bacterium]|nr:acyl-CoA dehydrogenase family protein [Alphaproteobacteria bacterium]
MAHLVFSEDEQLLADAARDVVEGTAPTSRVRALRDRGETHDAALWAELTELGWPAIPFPEAQGGLGMGLSGLVIVLEALGRNAVGTPLASTAMASRLPLDLGAAGGAIVALGWREDPRSGDPTDCRTRAHDGRLTGRKIAVWDAMTCDTLLVTAREDREDAPLTLWRVDPADAPPRRRAQVDHRDVADLLLEACPAERLPVDEATLLAAIDAGRLALAAEAVGIGRGVFARTLAYLHERHQFGVPIGSFQALQHRAVDVFVQLELATSAVMQAAREPTPAWIALAQAKSAQAVDLAAREAVQLHGGIGVTDECDVGFFVKRAMVLVAEAARSPRTRSRGAEGAGGPEPRILP